MELVMQGDVPTILYPRTANRIFEIQANTNLLDTAGWKPLNVPGNRPIAAAATEGVGVEDPGATNLMNRYYRILIIEP